MKFHQHLARSLSCIGLVTTLCACSSFNFYPEDSLGWTKEPPSPKKCCNFQATTTDIVTAHGCAEAMRDRYVTFLKQRERMQTWTGATVAPLAGGALGVAAAGVNAIAAGALGAAAGTGLGFDYAIYNKEKTKAYGVAVAQLQCVIEKTNLIDGAKDALAKQLAFWNVERDVASSSMLEAATLFKRVNLQCQKKQKKLLESAQTGLLKFETSSDDFGRRSNAKLNALISGFPARVMSVIRLVDARAFAASQAGVPDGDQIKNAVGAISASIPPGGGAAAATLTPSSAPVPKSQGNQSDCDRLKNSLEQSIESIKILQSNLDAINSFYLAGDVDTTVEACMGDTPASADNGGNTGQDAKGGNSKK